MSLVSLLFLQFLTGQHRMIEFTRCIAVALCNAAGNDARRRYESEQYDLVCPCAICFLRCLAAYLAAATQPYRNRIPTLPSPYRKCAQVSRSKPKNAKVNL
jgi:hypothetical protein